MTINDSHLVMEDRFFVNIPVILLLLGFVTVTKYKSTVNVFYPKIILWLNHKYNVFLVNNKAYHFIRMNHFYAVIFTIYLYKLYALIFLKTHHQQ